MTGFASMEPATAATLGAGEEAALKEVLNILGGRRLAMLTGAALSTHSGLPDYRGPASAPRRPMTYQEFLGRAANRRR
jgi:hypothetical protein